MKDSQVQEKLVTVTRKDLHPGYQLVQTGHAIADFAHCFPQNFTSWKENSNYLISLATQDEDSLLHIYKKLREHNAPVVAFVEPDHYDQVTAICFCGLPEHRKLVSNLPLALKTISGA